MKTSKLLFLSIMLVFCLFANTLSAQTQRVHAQGISFLLPTEIQTQEEADGFMGENTDLRFLVTASAATEEEIDNLPVIVALLTQSLGIEVDENNVKELALTNFEGVIMKGKNENNDIFIVVMTDKAETHLYLTVIEAYNAKGNDLAYTLINSYQK